MNLTDSLFQSSVVFCYITSFAKNTIMTSAFINMAPFHANIFLSTTVLFSIQLLRGLQGSWKKYLDNTKTSPGIEHAFIAVKHCRQDMPGYARKSFFSGAWGQQDFTNARHVQKALRNSRSYQWKTQIAPDPTDDMSLTSEIFRRLQESVNPVEKGISHVTTEK